MAYANRVQLKRLFDECRKLRWNPLLRRSQLENGTNLANHRFLSTIPDRQRTDRKWTIPNMLCIGRIAMSPLLSYLIINQNFSVAVGVLAVAGITDFVDGWIARNFEGQASKLGSFLDPLADKTLVITLYASLAYTHTIPEFLVSLIIIRDAALLVSGSYIRYISIPPPRTAKKYFTSDFSAVQLSPTLLSKINTAVQLLTAAVSLYAQSVTFIPETCLQALWYLAALTTVSSGISYIFAKNTYKISSTVKAKRLQVQTQKKEK